MGNTDPADVPLEEIEKYVSATVAASILGAFAEDMRDMKEYAAFMSACHYGLIIALDFPSIGHEMSRLLDAMVADIDKREPGFASDYQSELEQFREDNREAMAMVRKEILEAHERRGGPPLPGS